MTEDGRQTTDEICFFRSLSSVVRCPSSGSITLDQRPRHQRPAINENKENQLERQRHHDRRQHHHAHGHQHRGDHQIDDQERQEQQEADLEGAFELQIMKAGISTRMDTSSGPFGGASPDMSMNNCRSFSRTFFSMKPRSGPEARSNASLTLISLATSGLTPTS